MYSLSFRQSYVEYHSDMVSQLSNIKILLRVKCNVLSCKSLLWVCHKVLSSYPTKEQRILTNRINVKQNELKIKFIKDSQERKDRSLASVQWTLKAASIGIHKVQIMKSIENENEEMRTNRLTEEEKESEIEWETPWWLRNCAQPKREGSNAQAQYTDKERQDVRGREHIKDSKGAASHPEIRTVY